MIVIANPCHVCGTALDCKSVKHRFCSAACCSKAWRIRNGQPDTPEQPDTERYREQVLALLGTTSHAKIAQQIGIHRRSVERIAAAMGQVARLSASKKQRIVQYHRGGKGRAEIARLVECSLFFVDRTLEDYRSQAARRVKAYKCPGCDAAGVYWVTNLKPCVRCLARGGK